MRAKHVKPPDESSGTQAPNTFSNNRDPQENRPAWRGQVKGRDPTQ